MKAFLPQTIHFPLLCLIGAGAFNPISQAASVVLQSEIAIAGADWRATLTDLPTGTQYRNIISDTVDGEFPGSAARVMTFNVTFPAAGSYNLFARVRVGPAGANDDSLFYATSFGTKSPTSAADWIRINNLVLGGFTTTNSIVTGVGNAGIGVWKWVNLSQFTNGIGETPITFNVTAASLVQTFQIGGRENGLDIDQFIFGTASNIFTVAELDAGGPGTPPAPPPAPVPGDMVSGNLMQFNDNGAWTWYCDERTVVDKVRGRLIVGSDASQTGVGGPAREGDVEVAIYDFQDGSVRRSTLKDGASDPGAFYADDHNTPGLMVRPDGKYLAWYCAHNTERTNYWRNFDGTNWSAEQSFDWNAIPGGTDFAATYSNPHYLPAEERTYNFVRENDHGSPNILVSTNQGDTWTYAGQLIRSATNFNVGYVSGYFRYSDNGKDRVDFIGTEAHPRDYSTSMFHGYVKNGQSFKSDGALVDANIFDQSAPFITNFTPIFVSGTVSPPGQTNYRCWNDDVQSYADGTVQAIIATRINDNTQGNDDNIAPNHAFFFCRYDGTNWTSTYLCQAGTKLYSSEADYLGLGCVTPHDPDTIFISTRYDPRAVQPGIRDTNQTFSAVREIWKGVTTNHGASFVWTPITSKSVYENLRPIVPAWDGNHTVLVWFRCKYNSAQSFDAIPVGLMDNHFETPGMKTYVDATVINTFFADNSPLVTTGPDVNAGAADNKWHWRTGAGNSSAVLASAEVGGEDAPMLKTRVPVPEAGAYDVWANFWGGPQTDWRIKAGLSTSAIQLFRQSACKQVEQNDYAQNIVVTNVTGAFLYQAYLGRVTIAAGATFDAFIDDHAVQTGTASTLAGDSCRTWYDGISFAPVMPFQIATVSYAVSNQSITLAWNSKPAAVSLGTPTYTVQKKSVLSDAYWTDVAKQIPSAGLITSYTDTVSSGSAAFYRVVTE